ncbi:hypothetical protein FKP32DRAFT_1083535 [Trametes sanguinea]|nr:hypothetical protein FKP32DRAFT_1083535 [Trametes sanguinea]
MLWKVGFTHRSFLSAPSWNLVVKLKMPRFCVACRPTLTVIDPSYYAVVLSPCFSPNQATRVQVAVSGLRKPCVQSLQTFSS